MLTDDGRFVLTFNGEIYNFRELRASIEANGKSFRSTGDSEVVLRLFEAEGPAMVSKLAGMFAIAIYDRDTETLFLARDRLGIKPLYYRADRERFAYASETKAFLADPTFEPAFRRDLLPEYLLFRYVLEPETLLDGVRAVEPGTYLLLRRGTIEVHRYWHIPVSAPAGAGESDVESLLRQVVRDHLVSDVKVGCQLSGGIDSSLISDWARQAHGSLFDSVSVIVTAPGLTEEPYIDEANRVLGLHGHKTFFGAEDMARDFARATWHADFPIGHPNAVGILKLAGEARKHVTVLLSGEGADEVFGGYPRYRRAAWLARLSRISPSLRRLGPLGDIWILPTLEENMVALGAPLDPIRVQHAFPDLDLRRALAPRIALWRSLADAQPVERLLTVDLRTQLVQLLLRQDKMCMAEGIENRVPFVDHRVVELSKRLPLRLKIQAPRLPRRGSSAPHTKRVLKSIARKRFGPAFTYRKKSGFSVPVREMFQTETFQCQYPAWRTAAALIAEMAERRVDEIFERARKNDGAAVELAWTLIALGAWWDGLTKARRT
jgi:asparagine synthase (glutamine-hydrolysing)